MKKWLRIPGIAAIPLILIVAVACVYGANSGEFRIARLKYRGGGDWYSDPTSLPNLLRAVERALGQPDLTSRVRDALERLAPLYQTVDVLAFSELPELVRISHRP